MKDRDYNTDTTNYNYSGEVPPPETNYPGSSPPHRYCIYIDFDNIYGGCLDYIGIKAKDPISPLQQYIFSEVLKCFLSCIPYEIKGECAFIKAFAEYENLPHSSIFKPGIQIFLHNIGIKPISPFVSHGKRKNKNASDIALTLEVVNDLIIKNVPVRSVFICSGDIDFYPLLSWIREHTDKKVRVMSFSGRTNKVYSQVFDFKMEGRIIWLDRILERCFKTVIETAIRSNVIKAYTKDEAISWFKDKVSQLAPEHQEVVKNVSVPETEVSKSDKCSEFRRKLLQGLRNWLKKNEFASTGLVIQNWLPRWELGISEEEANRCLKELIESGELKREGFYFDGSVEGDRPIGEIRRFTTAKE